MQQTDQYSVVFVTAPSHAEAIALARSLVEAKLAACVTLLPVQSVYIWQEQVCEEQEWQLLIKTQTAGLDHVETLIRAQHSYDVPEFIALPIVAGSVSYLRWLGDSVADPASFESR